MYCVRLTKICHCTCMLLLFCWFWLLLLSSFVSKFFIGRIISEMKNVLTRRLISGLLWCFLSAVWSFILMASIHCRGSIDEHVTNSASRKYSQRFNFSTCCYVSALIPKCITFRILLKILQTNNTSYWQCEISLFEIFANLFKNKIKSHAQYRRIHSLCHDTQN